MAKVQNPFGEPETVAATSVKADLERYAKAPAKLELALEKLSESKLRWKPNPKKWSIREIVCHLADSDIVGVARMNLVVASSPEKPPILSGYNQDLLAERFLYNTQDDVEALQFFKYLRRRTTVLLKSLPDEAFEKYGIHDEAGKLTLGALVKRYADHAERHLKQIETLKEMLQAQER